ncbi:MAG: hypothetical protein ACRDQX_01655 [Pseudonocardiaceae bacterium]
MTDQPRTQHLIHVSIRGARADTDDNTAPTLFAVQEADGRWLIHPLALNRIAVHLVGPQATHAARATAHAQRDVIQLSDEAT